MKTKTLTEISLFTALVTLSTIVISIPIGSNGYINIGDTMILLSAILFGKKVGLLAGGIGSCLADILLGYGYFAPFTLIIKGIEGYLVGYFYKKNQSALKSSLIGVSVMVVGYFIASSIIEHYLIAIQGIPMNIIQGIICTVLTVLGHSILKKQKIWKS